MLGVQRLHTRAIGLHTESFVARILSRLRGAVDRAAGDRGASAISERQHRAAAKRRSTAWMAPL